MSDLDLKIEDVMIPASDPGIELFIRNKRPATVTSFGNGRTLLFVHGATYPASTCFDLRLYGQSWMDYIASRGYDAYLLDLRGYGNSTRPAEMSAPAAQNPPIVRGDVALRDISSAVEYITRRTGVSRINLLGWSWGTALLGTYATMHPERVERLALYAPLWLRRPDARTMAVRAMAPLPAYRTVAKTDALNRWLEGVPEAARSTLIPTGWFDQWVEATWSTDKEGSKSQPPVLRAPNGVIQDVLEYFYAGRPYYDPSKIQAPTLSIGVEWDNDNPPYMAKELFDLLPPSPANRHVLLAEGTHTILMEKNRQKLFATVQAFLDERH